MALNAGRITSLLLFLRLRPLVLLWMLTFVVPAHAEIYQWTDERGTVHFTDEPPDGAETRILRPQTENLGVEIIKPEQVQQWKDSTSNQTGSAGPGSPVSPRQRNAVADDSETDLCAGVVGDCFTDQQDYVCKLRFGVECQTLYHWKVCLHQSCEEQKFGDQCDSPYKLLSRRLIVITERDIGRPLPLKENVSERDWLCLSQHGFFCDEVASEKRCRNVYLQSCEQLKNWVTKGFEHCKKQRGSDCKDIDTLVHYRPVSVVESKKAGTLLANGKIASQDLFLQSLQADKDSPEQYPQLRGVLESLTGLNIQGGQRARFDCLRGNTTDIHY